MSAIMDSIYNNYLTTYSPLTQTRFDTHKKSELRSIYNSIVKLNKEAPLYLPTTSRETQRYAVNIKENARELYNSLANLGGLEEAGLLNRKRASSSDEDIVSAEYIGNDISGEVTPQFSITVDQLASPQENMGIFLPHEKVALRSANYSFDININDMNYEFQFSIGEDETNKSVQERLARLISNSGIGIKANILEDDNRSALVLTSDATGLPFGRDKIFTISDNKTSQRSGTVDYFGLSYVSHEPTNALFRINGEDRSASSNNFTVGKMFELNLKGVSPDGKSVEIGLKPDIESLTENISQLVGSYNTFIKSASTYLDTQSRSRQLLNEMHGIASLYEGHFSSMGVQFTEDGTLSVDSDLLKKTATDTESITDTFGYLRDFSKLLIRKSNQISINPMNYVDKTVVAYKNPGHNFVSPYTTSAYSGMMFNYYC